MFLGRSASREQIFKAANQLADTGERVTVAAVKQAVGGGSASDIRETLVDWRRDRQSRPAAPADNVVSLQTASPGLPGDVKALVDVFAQQLHRSWMEALAANTSPDDQMAVIRAAAEARMREETAKVDALEDALARAERRADLLDQEVRSLTAALDVAHQEMEIAGEPAPQPIAAPIDDGQIATLKAELAEAQSEIARLKLERETRASAAALMADAPEIDASDPPVALALDLVAGLEEKPAAASALREALRSAEAMRDMLREERDRLQDELDALKTSSPALADDGMAADLADARAALKDAREALAETETARDMALADHETAENERAELEGMIRKQAAWIEQARAKLEQAGLLKPAA